MSSWLKAGSQLSAAGLRLLSAGAVYCTNVLYHTVNDTVEKTFESAFRTGWLVKKGLTFYVELHTAYLLSSIHEVYAVLILRTTPYMYLI